MGYARTLIGSGSSFVMQVVRELKRAGYKPKMAVLVPCISEDQPIAGRRCHQT